jgi:predicted phosphodiesterase
MPQTIIDLLNRGIQANHLDKFRRGNLVHLPAKGSLIVSGDIHGHRRNLERIITYSDLTRHADRHVILQEIIHGGPEDDAGGCLSYQLLFKAVQWKIEFPDRIHIVMGNHDTAFIIGGEVMKNGKEMNRAMAAALEREFGPASADVKLAIRQFLFSQPLAARSANRIWMSHSLPGDRFVAQFDSGIFERELRADDCERPGSAYVLTWGRRHNQATLDQLAKRLDVDTFLLGHQPQPDGWRRAGHNLIILACDHNHGHILPVDLEKTCTMDELIQSLVPLASIE